MANVQWTGGTEHWTHKGDIRLFLWNKPAHSQVPKAGTICLSTAPRWLHSPPSISAYPGDPIHL